MAKNKYPFIFVHGMFGWGMDEGLDKKFPYWGATTGNLMDFLAENDYEGYALSVGPVSSAWDRACEIYARLMGTTVDYGKAHSARHNHRRFGRTYDKPLFEGGVSSERKIHLLGHSHGGITVRLLLHLLTDGDPEERAASGPDDISGLFTGGKGDWVQSITCICTPHNGTVSFDVAKKYKILALLEAVAINYVNVAGRMSMQTKQFFDFHLEQFGINNTPGKEDRHDFFQSKRNLANGTDTIRDDMSGEGASSMNLNLKPFNPTPFYFSYYFNAVGKKKPDKDKIAPIKTDFAFLYLTSSLIMFDNKKKMKNGDISYEDFANDGLVNVSSAMHPADEPFKKFDPNNIERGVWQVMPEREGDHGTAVGLFADVEKTHNFYLEIAEMLVSTETMEEPAAAEKA